MRLSVRICTGIAGTFVLTTAASANCPASDHDCFTTGGPGCTDIECCEAVCAADPFCCDVAWDGLCVSGAEDICDAPPCIGDIKPNVVVDGGDLGFLLLAWGTDGPGDLNGDGIVDGEDLGILLDLWGPCP